MPDTKSAFDFSLNVLTIGKDLAIDLMLKKEENAFERFLNFE